MGVKDYAGASSIVETEEKNINELNQETKQKEFKRKIKKEEAYFKSFSFFWFSLFIFYSVSTIVGARAVLCFQCIPVFTFLT